MTAREHYDGLVDGLVDVVARHVIACAVDKADREDYPDIGEHAWRRVLDRAEKLAPFPPVEFYRNCYDQLASRAEGATP